MSSIFFAERYNASNEPTGYWLVNAYDVEDASKKLLSDIGVDFDKDKSRSPLISGRRITYWLDDKTDLRIELLDFNRRDVFTIEDNEHES